MAYYHGSTLGVRTLRTRSRFSLFNSPIRGTGLLILLATFILATIRCGRHDRLSRFLQNSSISRVNTFSSRPMKEGTSSSPTLRHRQAGRRTLRAKNDKLDEFVERVKRRSTVEGNENFASRPELWSNTTYSDNAFDIAMTAAFRQVMGSVAGWQSKKAFLPTHPGESYEGLVEVAQALQWGKGAELFEKSVIDVLARFPRSPQLLQNNKLSMELLAILTPRLFAFLVGPSKVEEWKREDGTVWRSAVKIEKCRPTQRFFNEVAGLPLAMEPNLDDCSCVMTWGKDPIPKEQDPVGQRECFKWCPSKSTSASDLTRSISNAAGSEFEGNLSQGEATSQAVPSQTPAPPCPRMKGL
ncbi:hypothetical protein AAMO2058_000980800 [Amorphochlora amoebiformis]